jgi:GMP synthase (glutamine-hydrolysing)
MTDHVGRKKVLLVLHQAHSTPGRIGAILTALGARLDIRRPSLGEPLPKTLAGHDGAMVFGGPMSANDDNDWMKREIDWLAVPLREEKPFVGICLGAQMLARCLGARVFSYPDRRGEVGYFPIHPLAAGDQLCPAPFPRSVYQWHFDGFDLPKGAELLATGGEDFPNQAYVYGRRALGLQFHPEVTYHMMCRWTTRGHERLSHPGAQPRDGHLGGWFQHDGMVADWLGEFLSMWLDGAAFGAAQRASRPSPEKRAAAQNRPREVATTVAAEA